MAFSVEAEKRVTQEFRKFFSKKSIAEQCSKESLIRLHEAFLIAENREMKMSELFNAFENILKIKMSYKDFETLFDQIKSRESESVTWDEFISHLLLEFQEKDLSLEQQQIELPITGFPQMLKSHHRSPVCRIIFCPEVLPGRRTTYRSGYYLTISRDGTINNWSLDFQYERSSQSTNPYLKVQSTMITDMIVMPDIQIICTSSTERDLRFYDILARKFDLRVMILSLEDAVVCMFYYFSANIQEESYIILGDKGGSVKIMTFSSVDRGPFKQQPEQDLLVFNYENIVKGALKGLKVIDMKNVHTNWVGQVSYSGSLKGFMSCSRCSMCSLLLSDPTGTRMKYKFCVPLGISCFAFQEENQILVTGGPDCIVRIWNPFVPTKAVNIFQGHHACVCGIVIQHPGKYIYSLSKDRCIKVWDISAQLCIQTYNGLPSELSEYTPMTIVYNPVTHKLIIASIMIAMVVCGRVINTETSDGYTHAKPISCALYNNLFKVIVTTGLDSCIIVWEPWLGRRLYLVTTAHSHLMYGQLVSVEITAACFDGTEKMLLTGARDGSLKIWNFNTGTCIRNMSLETKSEITSVTWFENRMLCTSWNRRITEFALSESGVYRKSWENVHTDDILCSAIRYPQAIASASYNGELVLWRLETGQPYRRYRVYDFISSNFDTLHSSSNFVRVVAVRAMIFLVKRPVQPDTGTLFVSLDSGLIQVWSHHTGKGFITAFSVIHSVGDCALALATDLNNNFLVTGHRFGYVKVWLLENYLIPNPPKICMPFLRIEFPFLWKDRIDGRAKRAVKDQPLPLLLTSIRGHLKAVTTIQMLTNERMILSGSTDNTVRLWTFGGQYIATLGTFRSWSPIVPDVPIFRYLNICKVPADVKRFVSFTSLKVLHGGLTPIRRDEGANTSDLLREIPEHERSLLYGNELVNPILGNYIKFPPTIVHFEKHVTLDNTLQYIPIYTHLKTYPLNQIDLTRAHLTFSKERFRTQQKPQQKAQYSKAAHSLPRQQK